MDKKKIEHFKNRLLEERKNTVQSLGNMERREEETREQLNSELSSYDNHPADTGTEVYMMEQDKAFKRQLEDTLEEIDSSLEDIEKGRYGYCDNCDREIKEDRLELIPYVKTCLSCSDEDDLKDEGLEFETNDNERLGYISDTADELGYSREDSYKDAMEDNIVPNDPSLSTGDNMGLIDEDDIEDIPGLDELKDM